MTQPSDTPPAVPTQPTVECTWCKGACLIDGRDLCDGCGATGRMPLCDIDRPNPHVAAPVPRVGEGGTPASTRCARSFCDHPRHVHYERHGKQGVGRCHIGDDTHGRCRCPDFVEPAATPGMDSRLSDGERTGPEGYLSKEDRRLMEAAMWSNVEPLVPARAPEEAAVPTTRSLSNVDGSGVAQALAQARRDQRQREGETARGLDAPCPDCGLATMDATHDDSDTCIRALRAALSTERAAREAAERNVEDWHRCAMSSFADFVASDKKLSASEAALTTSARRRDALREELEALRAAVIAVEGEDIARVIFTYPVSRPTAGEQTTGTHPEDTCQHCGGPNVVWFAPNDLWNRVMGGEAGIVCPRCFVLAAEKAGISEIWKLAPDRGDQRLLDRTYTLTAHGLPLPLTGRQLLANIANAEDALEHPERESSLIRSEAPTSRSIPPSPDTATTSKVPNA